MSHKANSEFFVKKREWSKKKDQILRNYLTPYLAKVKKLGRPIFIVDAFAGPGKFESGEEGSPLIIAKSAEPLVKLGIDIKFWCIEAEPALHEVLRENLAGFDFAVARIGHFSDFISEIEQIAATSTCLLYIDPYTVKGLNWAGLERVFRLVSTSSVEILLNFNTPVFLRWGWQTLKGTARMPEVSSSELQEIEAGDYETTAPPTEALDAIVGGDWWQQQLGSSTAFHEQCSLIIEGIRDKLEVYFKEVLYCRVGASSRFTNLKYHLIFASRHPDALLLMNDGMIKATGEAELDQNVLFGRTELEGLILARASEWISRKELQISIVRTHFCKYRTSDIIGAIRELWISGKLETQTARNALNDSCLLRSAGKRN